ncbi:MAG TPA: PAS domain-containing protein, partial [Puia sp.]
MTEINPAKQLSFFTGEGEMAELMRSKNWLQTPVGDPALWPQSLKGLIRTILTSRFPMFIWWGPDLVCFYNDAYRPSLGENGKHPHILGMPAQKAWVEIWPVIKPLIDRVLLGESTWSEDQLIPIERNGKLEDVYWTFSYSPVADDDGVLSGVLVICQETTEKVGFLSALRDREDQLSFTIDAAELGTWDLNPVTNRFVGNAKLKSWFGLQQDDEIDLSAAIENIAAKDRERVVASIQEALNPRSGGLYNVEYSIIHPGTKKEFFVLARGKALFNEDNIPYRFSGTLQDLTSVKQASVRLSENEARLQVVIDASELGVWELTIGSDSVHYSGNYLNIFGMENDTEVNHSHLLAMLHPEDKALRDLSFARAIESGRLFYQSRIIRKDETIRWIEVYGRVFYNGDGQAEKMIGTLRDITEEKNNQRILVESEQKFRFFSQELEKQVHERTGELEHKNEELEKMNAELESFAYVSSHDLQEPLRKIRVLSSVLNENESGSFTMAGKDYLNRIQTSAKRMQILIEDLLRYSRTTYKDRNFEQTNLTDLLVDVIAGLNELIDEKHAVFDISPLCTIDVVPFQIRQLLYNLIGNALKFSRKNIPPVIRISAEQIPASIESNGPFRTSVAYCKLVIADNGIGFDQRYEDRIFDVFQRLNNRREYDGTGI